VKITLKGMESTNLLVKQSVSHLFIRAGRNTPGNHSSVAVNSHPVPTACGTAMVFIILFSSGVGRLIVCLRRPGLAEGGAEDTLPPCVHTLSL